VKGILRMVCTLVAISAVSAVGLAWVQDLTAERIREEIRNDTLRAIAAVLPAYDNAPDLEAVDLGEQRYYPARKGGEAVGLALPVRSGAGYGGEIEALVGIAPDGKVTGVQVLAHAETPGLGAKFTQPEFLAQFTGKTLDNVRWRVKKDGGEFDQITGATITPRALIQALEGGLQAYRRDRARVLAAASAAEKPTEEQP
jgi:electron transport complex protein RnfG